MPPRGQSGTWAVVYFFSSAFNIVAMLSAIIFICVQLPGEPRNSSTTFWSSFPKLFPLRSSWDFWFPEPPPFGSSCQKLELSLSHSAGHFLCPQLRLGIRSTQKKAIGGSPYPLGPPAPLIREEVSPPSVFWVLVVTAAATTMG